MRIMRFTILSLLTLLMLAIAIPAAATTCSICMLDTYVNADGSSQVISARCDPNVNGDIPDCRASRIRGGNAGCDSVSLVAACGEGGGNGGDNCPPWGCIQMVKAPRVHSMRPRRHSTV
jgi:hypothetical protein